MALVTLASAPYVRKHTVRTNDDRSSLTLVGEFVSTDEDHPFTLYMTLELAPDESLDLTDAAQKTSINLQLNPFGVELP